MHSTLLELCQEVARSTGVDVPSVIIGATEDDTASRLHGAASRAMRYLAKQHYWREMRRLEEITLSNGTKHYPLPSDYDRIIPHTLWDETNSRAMRGIVAPPEWQRWNYSITPAPAGRKIITFLSGSNGDVKVFPTPTASDVIVFEYVSRYWCESASGGGRPKWEEDTDLSRIDDDLVVLWIEWNFLRSMGMPYIDERSDAERMLAQVIAKEAPGPDVDFDQSPRRLDGLDYRLLSPPLGGLTGA